MVVPAVTPHNTPPGVVIGAIAGLELDQEPPVMILFSVVHEPAHTSEGPVIGYGARMIVSFFVATQPVGNV
jgi:hypothetical protein